LTLKILHFAHTVYLCACGTTLTLNTRYFPTQYSPIGFFNASGRLELVATILSLLCLHVASHSYSYKYICQVAENPKNSVVVKQSRHTNSVSIAALIIAHDVIAG
jgi:hypothetical protein